MKRKYISELKMTSAITFVLMFAVLLGVNVTTDARSLRKTGKPVRELVIIHTNDTHSHIEPLKSGQSAGLGGVIERAAFIDSVRTVDGRKNVLFLHAGDFNQGTSYYTILKGELEVNLVNAFGYDAIALGNHEFDNGIEDLTKRVKRIKCPVLCANYDFSSFELGKYVKPYTIVKRGGLKIGIIGVLTDISRVVSGDIASRLPKYDDAEVVNKWAKFLKYKKKCDLVIALTHIGQEGELLTDSKLVNMTDNIDIVVGGHSHTFLKSILYEKNLSGKETPIVTDGCWGLYMGQLDIYRK